MWEQWNYKASLCLIISLNSFQVSERLTLLDLKESVYI